MKRFRSLSCLRTEDTDAQTVPVQFSSVTHNVRIGDVRALEPSGSAKFIFNVRDGCSIHHKHTESCLKKADVGDTRVSSIKLDGKSGRSRHVHTEIPRILGFRSNREACLVLPECGKLQEMAAPENLLSSAAIRRWVEHTREVAGDIENLVIVTRFTDASSWVGYPITRSPRNPEESLTFSALATLLPDPTKMTAYPLANVPTINAGRGTFISGYLITTQGILNESTPIDTEIKVINLATGKTIYPPMTSDYTSPMKNEVYTHSEDDIRRSSVVAYYAPFIRTKLVEATHPYHPLKTINGYLLEQFPSASIAITHDDHWMELLKEPVGSSDYFGIHGKVLLYRDYPLPISCPELLGLLKETYCAVLNSGVISLSTIKPDDLPYDDTPFCAEAVWGDLDRMKRRLEKEKFPPNCTDSRGRTPLSYAAEYGHDGIVHLLAQRQDVEIDMEDDRGRTPLSYAAESGHTHALETLLAASADLNSKDENERTPLMFALRMNRHAAVKALLRSQRLLLNVTDRGGRTPLSFAAENDNAVGMKMLLDVGAVPDHQDSIGRTPLSYAAASEGIECLRLLLDLKKRVNVNSRDIWSRTPLGYAIKHGNEAAVELLLTKKNVDVNVKDSDDRTPLVRSLFEGYASIAKALLGRKGIDAHSADISGRTAVSYAAQHGFADVIKTLFQLRGKTSVNVEDISGRTPLSYAAENGMNDTAIVLVENGAYIESRDLNGRTPLSYAARQGRHGTVKMLLAKSAKVDSSDKFGRTPLSYAVEYHSEKAVETLLAYGADETHEDMHGMTPLYSAVATSCPTMRKLLEDAFNARQVKAGNGVARESTEESWKAAH